MIRNLTEKILLRLTKEDFDYLCELAKYNGLSVSEIIRQIITNFKRKDEENAN